jgi:hypothetical protein
VSLRACGPLKQRQQSTVSNFLLPFESHEYSFRLSARSEEGGAGADTELLDRALADRQVLMVPVVLTELLSDPKLPSTLPERCAKYLWSKSKLTIGSGRQGCEQKCWQRAARRASAMR